MKTEPELSPWEERRKRKTERLGNWLMFAVSAFLALVYTPVSLIFSNDILLANTVYPVIWDLLQYLLRFCFYWIAFAFALQIVCAYSLRGCRRFFAVYTACAAFRCLFSLLVGYLMTAGKDEWQNFGYELTDVLFETLADAVQLALVLLLFILLVGRKRTCGEKTDLLNSRLFRFRDPLNLTVLLAAFIPSLLQLISRVIYDAFIGAAQNKTDLIWMVVYYMLDVISFVAGYLVIYMIIFRLQIGDEEDAGHDNEDISGGHL